MMRRYVYLMIRGAFEKHEQNIRKIVSGIVEGEMRGISAELSANELFNNRKLFLSKIEASLLESLKPLGLKLYACSLREFDDKGGFFALQG